MSVDGWSSVSIRSKANLAQSRNCLEVLFVKPYIVASCESPPNIRCASDAKTCVETSACVSATTTHNCNPVRGGVEKEAVYWQGDPRSSCSPAASAPAASARDQFQRRHPGLPTIGRLCKICEASAQRCEWFSFGSASISSGTASALKEAA